VLAVAPASATGPAKLSGTVDGESDAKIKMSVQRNGGEPSAVKKFSIKGLDFSCFDDGESGEFKLKLENAFDVQRGFDASGKRIWTLFNKRDTARTDEFGPVGVAIFGETNQKASRMTGTVGFSFGANCINSSDGFDTYTLSR
jgi:hypothetical protein